MTLQLQLQLHYTTLHVAVVGEATTNLITTIPKNTTATLLSVQWICSAMPGLTTPKLSYSFPFETSATALCSATGINTWIYIILSYA